MNKIYFAGKFTMSPDESLPYTERLVHDYRSLLLEDVRKLVYKQKPIHLSEDNYYCGPFFCEENDDGEVSGTSCDIVFDAEYDEIADCDTFFAVFDERFTVGSVVELCLAIQMGKDIVIFYKEEEESVHEIKSEYWFAIVYAMKHVESVVIKTFCDMKDVVDAVRDGSVFSA